MDKTYDEAAVLQFMRNSTYAVDVDARVERAAWFGNFEANLINPEGTGRSARGDVWNAASTGWVYGFGGQARVVEGEDGRMSENGDWRVNGIEDGWLRKIRGEE